MPPTRREDPQFHSLAGLPPKKEKWNHKCRSPIVTPFPQAPIFEGVGIKQPHFEGKHKTIDLEPMRSPALKTLHRATVSASYSSALAFSSLFLAVRGTLTTEETRCSGSRRLTAKRLGHADARVFDRQGRVGLVRDDLDEEIRLGLT